jgi:hypothetical protein
MARAQRQYSSRTWADDQPRRRPLFWVLYFLWCVAYLITLDVLVHEGLLLLARREVLNQRFYLDPELGRLPLPHIALAIPCPEYSKQTVLFRTNNLGFREDHDTALTSASAHRIMVFGDSHTEGMVDNEDSFPHVAQRILNADGLDVEVLNAAAGMFSLYQEFLLFRRLLPVHPEIAIFAFYTGNDYSDLTFKDLSPYLTVDNGAIEEHPPLLPRMALRDVFAHRSTILSFLRSTIHWIDPRPRNGFEQAQRIKVHALSQSLLQAYYFEKVHPEQFAEVSRLQQYVVTRIVGTAKQNHVQLLFLILPTKYQIERESDAETFTTLEALLGLDRQNKFDDLVRRDFTRILNTSNVGYLDSYDELIRIRGRTGEELFWRDDQHLNDRGHRVVGAIVASKLSSMLRASVVSTGDPAVANAGG